MQAVILCSTEHILMAFESCNASAESQELHNYPLADCQASNETGLGFWINLRPISIREAE